MKLSLGKWGNHLSSRRLGQEIRFLLSDELKKGRRVEVDLKDVVTASPDFVAEAFAKLRLYVSDTRFKTVQFLNANEEVRDMIQHMIQEKTVKSEPNVIPYEIMNEKMIISV